MILKPPENRFKERKYPSVFLAGSIEMGKATHWQRDVGASFDDDGWTVFDPRRDDWDSSWEQRIDNPQFRAQVEWELDGLEKSHYGFFYFEPGTMAPVTLLELGLFARKKAPDPDDAVETSALAVVCPEGFWRKGNVDIVCERNGIRQFNHRIDAVNHLKDLSKYWI